MIPESDPDSEIPVCFKIKKKKKIVLDVNNFLKKHFFNYKKIMAPEEIVIFFFNLTPFSSIFTCVNPDPYSEYGSIKFLYTDPNWIRIH